MSESALQGLVGLVALVVLIVARLPVGLAMVVVGAGGIAAVMGPMVLLSQLKTLLFGQVASYDLSVIPMFLLMGALAARAGFSRDLFRAAQAWMGGLPGGSAMAAIAACAGFGAVSGSSLATASTMGRVALPELRRAGYANPLATGTLAAGGVLGILIPPSVVLILYAVLVEANVVTMFAAALVPGLIAVGLFLGVIALQVARDPKAGPAAPPASRAERRAATRAVLPVIAIFLLVLGGIYGGLFNPTPAAAIGVFLTAAAGAAMGRLRLPDLRAAVLETAATTGMIFLILFGAELLKIFLSRLRLPQMAAEWMLASGLAPLTLLLILLAVLVVLGCLLDSLSMILLAIPFFWPVMMALNGGPGQMAEGAGFAMSTEDLKIWFGILALIVVELGLITPPVGMNVFVIAQMARDVPMAEVFRGTMPFLFAELGRVALLIAAPGIVLWLPGLLAG